MKKKYAEQQLEGAKTFLDKCMRTRNNIQDLEMDKYETFYGLWQDFRGVDILKELDEEDHYYECYHDDVIEFPSPNALQSEYEKAVSGIKTSRVNIRKYQGELGKIKSVEQKTKDDKVAKIAKDTGLSPFDVKRVLKAAK